MRNYFQKFTNFTVLTVFLVMFCLLTTTTYAAMPAQSQSLAPNAFVWAIKAGRRAAIYLMLPSNRISRDIPVSAQPAGTIVAKYSPETASGAIFVSYIRRKGANIIARIEQLTPRNFSSQVAADADMWNYVWWAWDSSCGAPTTPPGDPTLADQPRYCFTRIKDWQPANPCWKKIGLKDFYRGDGLFHNVSLVGFLKLVALAAYWNRADMMYVAVDELQRDVQTHKSGGFIRKKITTTVKYYVKPRWLVGAVTWRKCADMNHCGLSPNDRWIGPSRADITVNPWYEPWRQARFIWADGDLNDYPTQEKLIYQWSQTKKSWGFLAVALVSAALGALTGGAGMLANAWGWGGVAAGAGAGALASLQTGHDFSGGYAIKGFLTADKATPPPPKSANERQLQKSIESNWVKPAPRQTGGGFQVFISYIDPKSELGGYETLPMSDSRAKQVYQRYFHKPWEDTQFVSAVSGM